MDFIDFLERVKEQIRLKYLNLREDNSKLDFIIDKLLQNILRIYEEHSQNVDDSRNSIQSKILSENLNKLIENRNKFLKLKENKKEYFTNQKKLIDDILNL